MSKLPTELQDAINQWVNHLSLNRDHLDLIVEAARRVADLPTPEEISEKVNAQSGVRDGWFNPFHAQAVLLTIGMGDKEWSVSKTLVIAKTTTPTISVSGSVGLADPRDRWLVESWLHWKFRLWRNRK